jgi:anaerobic selenocysteine-containing dehydrogenase
VPEVTEVSRRVAYRTCPICEASCGLALELDGARVARVRGDERDVLARGYLCPKGAALGELHHDADRLRAPLVRGADGRLHEASWDDAFAEVERRLRPVRTRALHAARASRRRGPSGPDRRRPRARALRRG